MGAEYMVKLDEEHALLTRWGGTNARTLLIVLHVASKQWRVAGVQCACQVRATMRDVSVTDLMNDATRGTSCSCTDLSCFTRSVFPSAVSIEHSHAFLGGPSVALEAHMLPLLVSRSHATVFDIQHNEIHTLLETPVSII